MKRILLVLLTIILVKTISFSSTIYPDTIVSITPEQLKTTNLIFLEHDKLFQENNLLNIQLNNYHNQLELYKKSDSIQILNLRRYQNITKEQQDSIDALTKEIERKKDTLFTWKFSSISIGVVLLLWLIFK